MNDFSNLEKSINELGKKRISLEKEVTDLRNKEREITRLKEGMSDPKYDFRWPIRQFKNTIDNCIGTVRLVKLEDLINHGYIVWSSSY